MFRLNRNVSGLDMVTINIEIKANISSTILKTVHLLFLLFPEGVIVILGA